MTVPVRTCVGCRGRSDVSSLVRVVSHVQPHQTSSDVSSATHYVVVDERRTMPGRGAWLHKQPSCLKSAQRKNAFVRALRVHSELDLTALVEYINT
ncbi:YlxR family protein [Timonella sp. A28]|uniref:YlxR family protein n=1 Tax=Timonella sp. A28 TaxID=3442640 RepID=UPI003EB924E4